MKKHFYFASCVLSLLLLNTLCLIGMDIRNLLTTGLTVIVCFIGAILFELYEQHLYRKKAEETLALRIAKLEFLTELIRNTQLDNLNQDTLSSTSTAETLKILGQLCTKLNEMKEKTKTENKEKN